MFIRTAAFLVSILFSHAHFLTLPKAVAAFTDTGMALLSSANDRHEITVYHK